MIRKVIVEEAITGFTFDNTFINKKVFVGWLKTKCAQIDNSDINFKTAAETVYDGFLNAKLDPFRYNIWDGVSRAYLAIGKAFGNRDKYTI